MWWPSKSDENAKPLIAASNLVLRLPPCRRPNQWFETATTTTYNRRPALGCVAELRSGRLNASRQYAKPAPLCFLCFWRRRDEQAHSPAPIQKRLLSPCYTSVKVQQIKHEIKLISKLHPSSDSSRCSPPVHACPPQKRRAY